MWRVELLELLPVHRYGVNIVSHSGLAGILDSDRKQKKVNEYDQEIPQSQTADNTMAPRGRATQPSRETRKTNFTKQPALSSPSRCLQN